MIKATVKLNQSEIDRMKKDYIDALIKEGVEYAKEGVSSHIDEGTTYNSISGTNNGDIGTLSANGAAVWLEFGTGVAKNGSGYVHPNGAASGVSEIGKYGKGNGSNPGGWAFPSGDGSWKWTDGIKATMFMYNALKRLEENAQRIADEVFK